MNDEIKRLTKAMDKWRLAYDAAVDDADDTSRKICRDCIVTLERDLIKEYRNLGQSYTAPAYWGTKPE